MPDPTQALAPAVYDASLVRICDLATALLAAQANGAPTEGIERSIIDLNFVTEYAAQSVAVADQTDILSYGQETYGLLAVYTDPLLRAQLPPVPAVGGIAQPYYLMANGEPILANGKLIFVGARIIPNAGSPVFNTRLLPTQTTGAVTYNGDPGSTFDFNMPLPDSLDGPQQLFLYVAGAQVGRIDFPSTAVGNYFRLTRNGIAYLGLFQIVPDPDHLALTPELP